MADESNPFERQTEQLPEPATSAVARLRAWEDEHLGVDTPRTGAHAERGVGAPLRNLSPELQREHAALEHLIDAEKKVDEAAAHLAAADLHHENAKAHAANAADAVAPRSESEQGA